MSLINRSFVIPVAVAAAACLVSAAFAQTAGSASTPARDKIQRAADLVNLMRTVLDPNPAPLLASPAERAVSGRTSADPASPVVTTVPAFPERSARIALSLSLAIVLDLASA